MQEKIQFRNGLIRLPAAEIKLFLKKIIINAGKHKQRYRDSRFPLGMLVRDGEKISDLKCETTQKFTRWQALATGFLQRRQA
jgi:hypothetical protein